MNAQSYEDAMNKVHAARTRCRELESAYQLPIWGGRRVNLPATYIRAVAAFDKACAERNQIFDREVMYAKSS